MTVPYDGKTDEELQASLDDLELKAEDLYAQSREAEAAGRPLRAQWLLAEQAGVFAEAAEARRVIRLRAALGMQYQLHRQDAERNVEDRYLREHRVRLLAAVGEPWEIARLRADLELPASKRETWEKDVAEEAARLRDAFYADRRQAAVDEALPLTQADVDGRPSRDDRARPDGFPGADASSEALSAWLQTQVREGRVR
jgi:hypothetical protein